MSSVSPADARSGGPHHASRIRSRISPTRLRKLRASSHPSLRLRVDGARGAFEVKLGTTCIEEAADNLQTFGERADEARQVHTMSKR